MITPLAPLRRLLFFIGQQIAADNQVNLALPPDCNMTSVKAGAENAKGG
jgi:hypothetical protein